MLNAENDKKDNSLIQLRRNRMIYQAKEGEVIVNGTAMPYVVFGSGTKPLILLPGLSDGIKSVRGHAAVLAFTYREFAKKYKVYMFSRKDKLEKHYSIKDMAIDQKIAMDKLSIKKCFMLGVSQGGMIGQQFAINYPDSVEKLVIAVSTSQADSLLKQVTSKWISFARNDDYASLITDTIEKSYTERKLKKMRLMYPIIRRVGKPEHLNRFIIQTQACSTYNVYDMLHEIQCPTLLIGGKDDKIVGIQATIKMAQEIKDSHLLIYPNSGHAAYEEERGFVNDVMKFLQEE